MLEYGPEAPSMRIEEIVRVAFNEKLISLIKINFKYSNFLFLFLFLSMKTMISN